MNILVAGAFGQLGKSIKKISSEYSQYNFTFLDYDKFDITDYNFVSSFFNNKKIQFIINCAAYTNVASAEKEVYKCFKVNCLGVLNLSKISKELKIGLIHISTDYVFEGDKNKPYNELDKTNPKSIYGLSKLFGEKAMRLINPKNSIIIRTSWLYSKYGDNFINKILKIAALKQEISVIDDQIGTPTNANDLANSILQIVPHIKNHDVEIYHYSNLGYCSWYDFAIELKKIKNFQSKIIAVNSSEFESKVCRPKFSVMDKSKFQKVFSVKLIDWKESLRIHLSNNE